MSGDFNQNSEFLVELSDRDQETIGAGYSRMHQPFFFFFSSEETEIETASESEVNIASQGFSSRGRTYYSLSQRNTSFGGFFPLFNGMMRRSFAHNPLNFLRRYWR